ncbi:MAG: hypothetical protein RR929_01085 [Erysipelotrichaceae bacterium]
MNNSNIYFKNKSLESLTHSMTHTLDSIKTKKIAREQVESIKEDETIANEIEELIISYNTLLDTYKNLIIVNFDQAYIQDRYNLTTQDIYKMLDIAPSKTTQSLQKHVDYVKTVRYTGEWFDLQTTVEFFDCNFVALRELKNTKIFYSLDSFKEFLLQNLECINIPDGYVLDLEQLALDLIDKKVCLHNANTLKNTVVLASVKARNKKIAINNIDKYFNVKNKGNKNMVENYVYSLKNIDKYIQLQKLEINNVQLDRYLTDTDHLKFKLTLKKDSVATLYMIENIKKYCK